MQFMFARELHAAEFVLVVPWRQEKMIAELSELLRASPLPVKLFPDCTIRTTVGRRSHLALSAYHAVENTAPNADQMGTHHKAHARFARCQS